MKYQKFKLIKGEYLPKDSREILQNVFSGKIQFHNMKNFSSQERYGKDDKNAVKRIPQLKKSLGKIIKMIETAERNGEQLEIKSEVVIRFVKPIKDV